MTTATAIRTLSGPQVLRPKQLKALLAAPDKRTRRGRRDAALIAVLGCGGLRLGEATHLLVENVEMSGDTPRPNQGDTPCNPRQGGPAPSRVRITTRTAKSRGLRFRTITLPGIGAKALRDHLAHSQPRLFVFEGRRREALSTRQAGRIVRYYLAKIGRSDLRPHSLRHSVGAIVTRQSGVWVAQKVLGHASPTTTSRFYSAFDVTDSDAAADAIERSMG